MNPMKRSTLAAIAALGLAAALAPASLANGSASATVSCGQQMSVTFNGFTKTTTVSVTVAEDGNTSSSQFSVTGAGTDNLANADPGHTWEVYASWQNPDSTSGIFDSGPVSCAAPQTQVSVDQTSTPPSPGQSAPTTTTVAAQAGTPATADFTATATGGLGEVDYEATTTAGTNPIQSTVWYFGDGASATGNSATHAYQFPGEYVVTLEVVDTGGLTTLVAHEVTVTENGGLRMGPRVAAFGKSVIVKTRKLTTAKKTTAAKTTPTGLPLNLVARLFA